MERAGRASRRGGQRNGVISISAARVMECSKCGCEWTVSSQAYIPEGKYTCPHCASRERENNALQRDKDMAKRSLLHRSKIEDFKAWLQEDGWQIEKTKGIYEVVRATKPNRKPLIAYTRGNKEGEHVSVQERDESVVRAYARDRRREARAAQAGVKKIAKEEAAKVIGTRKPLGKFYLTQGRTIVAIDNTTGDAWTEEFKSFETFYHWITTQLTVEEAEKTTGRRHIG
jgi:hypothetical protein